MSVADTVTAFAETIAAGAGAEDVAVCFGITPLTVQRRLKLKVWPVLFELFRQDKINLDQLMALAITDDHAAQERVGNSTPYYNRNASGLRRLRLGREIDAATDPLAKFVGIPAYEAAGGVVVRELFEDAGSGYMNDAELLQRLAWPPTNRSVTGRVNVELNLPPGPPLLACCSARGPNRIVLSAPCGTGQRASRRFSERSRRRPRPGYVQSAPQPWWD